jgi:hypothetical protein
LLNVAKFFISKKIGGKKTQGSGAEQCFFIGSILICGQSGDDPEEYLARFGYRMNINLKNLNILLYFWLQFLNHECRIWLFFLNFWSNYGY